MIRTMVVEDEPPILKSVSHMIGSENPQFQVVAQAMDGKEAIDILRDLPVDVVFTDVSMPVMDGLSVCEFLRENRPEVKVVILSGYSDFNYAQQAIRYGVYDYILKPLRRSELSGLLSRLEKMVTTQQGDAARSTLCRILHEGETGLSLDLPKGGTLTLLSVYAGAYPLTGFNDLSSGRDFLDAADLEGMLRETLLTDELGWVIGGRNANEKVLVLSLKDSARVQKLLTKTMIFLTAKSALPITLIASPPLRQPSQLHDAYADLCQQVRKRLVFGKSTILNQAEKPPIYQVTAETEAKLSMLLKKRLYTSFLSEVKGIFEQVAPHPITQLNLKSLLDGLFYLIRKSCSGTEQDLSDLKYNISDVISTAEGYDDLFDNLSALLQSYFTQNDTQPGDIHSLLVRMDEYINAHLTESLTNQMLSAQFGLVPSYISRLFKSYKGVSPSEYIQNLRIEKAKQLLATESELKTKDIAQIVGYSDPFYFSRVFKNVSGYSPTQYRKLYHQEKSY